MAREHGRMRKPVQGKAYSLFSNVAADIRALNSSILIISQKMKYLVRNEKILGRNLLVLNKKIKALEEGAPAGSMTGKPVEGGKISGSRLDSINRKLEELTQTTVDLQSALDEIRENYVKNEQLQEVKYVMDSINPMELTTFDDVKKIVKEHAKSGKK